MADSTLGSLNDNHFRGSSNIGHRGGSELHLAEILNGLRMKRVPSNVETAAFTPAVNDTWEDYDIITALNAVLTSDIPTGVAVRLLGTIEFVNGEAGVNNAKYAHGGTPDNDDTVRTFATQAAAASEYVRGVELLTDSSGNIKIEVDDRTNLTLVFHLEGYQVIDTTATT